MPSGAKRSISLTKGIDQGDSGAAILDSIAYGLELLKKEPASNRRAILLISQEHDDGSKISLKEIVRDLGEANTAVYSISFSAEKDCGEAGPEVSACESADFNNPYRRFYQGL